MNANELADWFDGKILYLWDAEDGQYYDSAIADEIVPTLRNQQAEIEFLKKEILEKHEDWKHEGQQAANARAEIDKVNAEWVQATTALVNAVQEIHGKQAEIEALKDELTLEVNEKCKLGHEIEALKAKLNADKFCDANCVWTDHHPDCQIGRAQEK